MISSFTCLIRPDYNFAFALLSYYALKWGAEAMTKTLHLVDIFYLQNDWSLLGYLSKCSAVYIWYYLDFYDGVSLEW